MIDVGAIGKDHIIGFLVVAAYYLSNRFLLQAKTCIARLDCEWSMKEYS